MRNRGEGHPSIRSYESFLKVDSWMSEYKSVQNLLNHLQGKTNSEKSRRNYIEAVYYFAVFIHEKNPDRLAPNPTTPNKERIENDV